MGDIKYVMSKYKNHVTSNINSKPSMSFTKGGGKYKKLTNFIVFGETSGKTECFIDAHGGNYSADYVLDSKSFKVPSGVTVNFYQPAGYTMGSHNSELRSGPPKKHGGTNDQTYSGGQQCPNYMLTKFAGRHSGLDPAAAHAQEGDYEGLQSISKDAGIVLVTVRNRWFHAGITLKQAIDDIRSSYKSITTFNCMFCRVDDTTPGLAQTMWNASPVSGGSWV